MRRQSKIVVLSPSLQGGSWRWIEEVIAECGGEIRRSVIVGAYGRSRAKRAMFPATVCLPFIPYDHVGMKWSNHTVLPLLYVLPLSVLAQLLLWMVRPRAVIANGVLLAVAATPYARLTGAKLYLAYHGYTGGHPVWVRRLVGKLLLPVDLGIANSIGSERDLVGLMGPQRVLRIEHWADDIYFQGLPRRERGEGRLKILYVGRLDEEKVGFLVRVVQACVGTPLHFTFVGAGPMAGEIGRKAATGSVDARGYVHDKAQLVAMYHNADVVWAVADDTYLAKPGTEALAAGVPVIVPDVPAVRARALAGIRVPHDLLPSSVAWIIDGEDVQAARALLLRLAAEVPDRSAECRAYARLHYSRLNAAPLVHQLQRAMGRHK